MPHLLPLLLLIFLGCGVGYTEIAGGVRPITPTPPSTSVSPSGAALQQFIRSVEEYGAPVKQVSVKPRGRDIYAGIIVEQNIDPTEAEALLDHALEMMEDSLSSEPGWFNHHIRVLRPTAAAWSRWRRTPRRCSRTGGEASAASLHEAPVRHLPDV